MRLDEQSREHIGRYGIKLVVAAAIAHILKSENFLATFALWTGIYGVMAIAYAIRRGERFGRTSFTYWDEALWLAATALGLYIFSGHQLAV
ncbi:MULTISPECIES: hypothetical protein [unclassified Haematobacter]|jgi:hypothetical protein|uniref:hypothetical protein n=1 Tax=unclassified Haematobacter TaxID=2640585 RepID=UPI0025BB5CA6|nr:MULTISPECIES: hypothetical protein [unclassified Haematobacter]